MAQLPVIARRLLFFDIKGCTVDADCDRAPHSYRHFRSSHEMSPAGILRLLLHEHANYPGGLMTKPTANPIANAAPAVANERAQ